MQSSTPVFGKRNRSAPAARSSGTVPAAQPDTDHRAFFAAVRSEIAETETSSPVVARSFRAAILAGLVVGSCLAGLDVTKFAHPDPTIAPLLQLTGLEDTRQTLPYLMGLSLLSGARIAGTTLLLAHRVLAWAGQTGHVAYAAGGAAMAALYAGVMMAITSVPPSHGWLVTTAAGAGAGFFYRMFAGGVRPSSRPRPRA